MTALFKLIAAVAAVAIFAYPVVIAAAAKLQHVADSLAALPGIGG